MTALLFSRSVPLARRQLLARRGRTSAGVVGIAVAFVLVLALKAIFAGMEEQTCPDGKSQFYTRRTARLTVHANNRHTSCALHAGRRSWQHRTKGGAQ